MFARLDFTSAFTPFEYATDLNTAAALKLLDAVIVGPPFTHPIPIAR